MISWAPDRYVYWLDYQFSRVHFIQPVRYPMFNFKSRNLKPTQNSQLSIEALENREMLSAVQIFAAGDLGGEQFALQIDGQTVEQFTVGQQLSAFDFQADQPITASQVRIQFLNDQFDPAAGIDANLIVDAIEIDGVRFETEASSVFSTCLLYTSPSPRDRG